MSDSIFAPRFTIEGVIRYCWNSVLSILLNLPNKPIYFSSKNIHYWRSYITSKFGSISWIPIYKACTRCDWFSNPWIQVFFCLNSGFYSRECFPTFAGPTARALVVTVNSAGGLTFKKISIFPEFRTYGSRVVWHSKENGVRQTKTKKFDGPWIFFFYCSNLIFFQAYSGELCLEFL